MAEYKRIVSYFYHYVNGERGGLAGHGKVEQKGDRLRFSLDCQGTALGEKKKLRVFLFWKDGEEMRTSFVGSLEGKNRESHFEIQGESGKMLPQGKELGKLDGIVLYQNAKDFYASIWTEIALDGSSFHIDETKILNGVNPMEQNNEVEEEKSKEDIATNYESDQKIKEADAKGGDKETVGDKEDSQPTNPQYDEKKYTKEAMMEAFAKHIQKSQMKKSEETVIQEEVSGEADKKGTATGVPVMQEKMEEFIRDLEAKMNPGAAEGLKSIFQQERDTSKREEKDQMFETFLVDYPKLNHYSNPTFMKCVRITPQDIGKLPRWNWHLGTNSFSMHGFMAYQYLMCGYIKNGYGKKDKVLGVPGIFSNEDNYLAGIFGFEQFVPAKLSTYKTGEFGYWITNLVETQ